MSRVGFSIFMHCALMKRFDLVFGEIFPPMVDTGLIEEADSVTICFIGNKEKFDQVRSSLPKIDNLNCIYLGTDYKQYEFPTIQRLWEHCQKSAGNVFYCQTKGASHIEQQYTAEKIASCDFWRKSMIDNMIKNWRGCVSILQSGGYDGCGLIRRARHIFSGNFWWATCAHVRQLPFPTWSRNRVIPEYWIGATPVQGRFYFFNVASQIDQPLDSNIL
jgi:hypothetical protein